MIDELRGHEAAAWEKAAELKACRARLAAVVQAKDELERALGDVTGARRQAQDQVEALEQLAREQVRALLGLGVNLDLEQWDTKTFVRVEQVRDKNAHTVRQISKTDTLAVGKPLCFLICPAPQITLER